MAGQVEGWEPLHFQVRWVGGCCPPPPPTHKDISALLSACLRFVLCCLRGIHKPFGMTKHPPPRNLGGGGGGSGWVSSLVSRTRRPIRPRLQAQSGVQEGHRWGDPPPKFGAPAGASGRSYGQYLSVKCLGLVACSLFLACLIYGERGVVRCSTCRQIEPPAQQTQTWGLLGEGGGSRNICEPKRLNTGGHNMRGREPHPRTALTMTHLPPAWAHAHAACTALVPGFPQAQQASVASMPMESTFGIPSVPTNISWSPCCQDKPEGCLSLPAPQLPF